MPKPLRKVVDNDQKKAEKWARDLHGKALAHIALERMIQAMMLIDRVDRKTATLLCWRQKEKHKRRKK
jgi:hypothetical protein